MKEVIIVPRGEHSPLGPSSSKRWIHCPGSVGASVGAPDDESRYAAEGTAAHYLSELCRKQNKFAIDWLGFKIKADKYEFEVDEEMCDSVQEFVDWAEEAKGTPLVEQRIGYSEWFSHTTINEFGPAFGTLDDARLNEACVNIMDFKHGKGIQEFAEWSTQLLLQALGVYNDFGHLYDIKEFNLCICQPRLSHKDSWTISVADLLEWAKKIKGYGEAIELGLHFEAGDWCRFCRVRRKCVTRAESAMATMLEDFDDLDAEGLETAAMRATNALNFVSNERLAQIIPSLDLFKAWIKDVEQHAIYQIIKGEAVGDYKLVEGRSNRKAVDVEKFAAKLVHEGVDPYQPRKVLSVAQAESRMGKKIFAGKFDKGTDWVKPQGKPKLAPGSDKRPELAKVSLEDFENLDERDD